MVFGNASLAVTRVSARAIDLLVGNHGQYEICRCHRVLGKICYSMGETENAIDHFEMALKIASPFEWHNQLSRNHYELAAGPVFQGRQV